MKNGKKKIMIPLLVTLFQMPMSLHAFNWEWDTKYLGEVHAGYNTTNKVNGVNTYTGAAIFGTLQGVQLNKYASVAFGADVNMLTHYYKNQDIRWKMATFIDMRGYFPVTEKFSPFLNLALGATFYVHPAPTSADFYCEFGPGFRYKHLDFSCGLQHVAKKINHFYAKIGIFF